MRPLSIEFSAFGSYPGTVHVDFRVLAARGLFAITGPTGSGKTTVFDAMAFALYGKMPMKDAADIRSHHAEATLDTVVSFRFSVEGVEYLAERSPEYLRPRIRGTGFTPERAKARLERVDPDGGTTVLANGINDCNARCAEIVGLSLDQFTRVLLLPQGEVTRFLLDTTGDREALLAKLFGGEVFERVVEHLKARDQRTRSQVSAVDERLRHFVATAAEAYAALCGELGRELDGTDDELDDDALSSLFDACRPEVTALESQATEARTAAAEAQERRNSAEEAARRFDNAEQLRRRIEVLTEVAATVDAAERRAHDSARARPVVLTADAAARADTIRDEALRSRGDLVDAVVDAAQAAGIELVDHEPGAVARELAEARARLTVDLGRLDDLAEKRAAAASAEARATDQQGLLHDANVRHTELDDRRRSVAATIAELLPRRRDVAPMLERSKELAEAVALRTRLASLLADLVDVQDHLDAAEQHHGDIWERFIATEAPRLASRLVHGEECPVCGSCEHPKPAATDASAEVGYADVEVASGAVKQAQDRLRDVQQTISELRGMLGADAEPDDADFHAVAAAHAAELDEARTIEERLTGLEEQERSLGSDMAECQATIAGLTATLAAANDAATAANELLARAKTACEGLVPERVGAALRAIDDATGLAARLDETVAAATAATAAALAAHNSADDELSASPFPDVAAARAALLAPEIEAEGLRAADEHRNEVAATHTSLRTLETLGIPDSRPVTDELAAAADASTAAAEAISQRATLAADALERGHRALEEHRVLGADSRALRDEAATVRRAYLVCSGQGAVKMNLRRWVLGIELDRVVAAASVHLGRMTGGRYTLKRKDSATNQKQAFGLELEVLDAHTGRPRPPTSLSGGEQFQASLALALGLADVISLGGSGSGRRMEALFIDEGFGSLDPDALDEAIEALHQLRSSGRMVGAITHVEAMKERLHPGIEVRRLPSGRGSELVVNP
jgi:DNA repair protein SbcC/Rad50